MITGRDFLMIIRAARVATASTERMRHGAVLFKSGRVLSVGVNTFRNDNAVVSNPIEESSYHAEINAITGVSVAGATVYVARIRRDWGVANSQPCIRCMARLEKCGLKRVVWSTDDPNTLGEYKF